MINIYASCFLLDVCDETLGQSCYWIEDGIMTFDEAEYICQGKHGHLIELDYDAEYDLIAAIFDTGL